MNIASIVKMTCPLPILGLLASCQSTGGPGPTPPTPITPAPTMQVVGASQIQSIDILPDPTPKIPCGQSWTQIRVTVVFDLAAANIGNNISLRLVDDDGLSDDLVGAKTVLVPTGLTAGNPFTVSESYAASCSTDCNVQGAESTGETDPTLKIEFESGGDNYGEGTSTGGGTAANWPGQMIKCDAGGLWGLLE